MVSAQAIHNVKQGGRVDQFLLSCFKYHFSRKSVKTTVQKSPRNVKGRSANLKERSEMNVHISRRVC